MTSTRATSAFVTLAATVLLVTATAARSQAQTDTTAVPEPPAEQLSRLAPFFGTYRHDDQFWMGSGPFRGTLDVRPVVKGWFVDFSVFTHFGPIDRERHMRVTWDDRLGRYRVWGFETTPQVAPGEVEGEARFEGDEFVMEWKNSRGPEGQLGTFRNRIRMDGPNTLVIVSEVEPADGGGPFELGTWTNHRILARSPGPDGER